MTRYFTDRRDSWVIAIDNNIVTGETYKAKDYIKAGLGGRWDADRKVWIIDLSKVEAATKSSTGLYDASAEQIAATFPSIVAKAQPKAVASDEIPSIYEVEMFERRMADPKSDL